MSKLLANNKLGKIDRSQTATTLGYPDYKSIKFQYITGIHIDKFRSLVNRDIKLGKYLTLITGKNGTMKSSILGLIAHPFSSPNAAEDMYGNELKTRHSDVFKLSKEKDKENYIYYLQAITDDDKRLSEPIRMYFNKKEERHRVTVGIDNQKGMGNFSLNTSYLNLKRLFPILETNAKKANITISREDQTKIARAYEKIMQRSAYSSSEAISDSKSKNTLGPSDSYYDFSAISSGEDNLGFILSKMMAFERFKTEGDSLQGLLCIDEIEASLHPIAQIKLIRYLKEWSKKHHMQTIVTTHSLFLVDYCLKLQEENPDALDEVVINNISTQQVGDDHNFNIMINPDFKTIYKELTFTDTSESSELYKVNLICEDSIAAEALKKIIKKRNIIKNIDFITDVSGTEGSPWKGLVSLAKNGRKLLDDSIIVLDPDVPEGEITRLNFPFILKIPDINSKAFCLERQIVNYLYHLDGSHELFKDKEKDFIISEFTNHGIFSDNIDSGNISSDLFKKWVSKNKTYYSKVLTQYIKENKDVYSEFANHLLMLINQKRAKKALPPLNF